MANGDLDVPLEMDRRNLFGAFTESFDLMRSELKRARIAKSKANASKKELIAKLSHDIKTPVASIKAAAEVGSVLSAEEKTRTSYAQIIQKADQITPWYPSCSLRRWRSCTSSLSPLPTWTAGKSALC